MSVSNSPAEFEYNPALIYFPGRQRNDIHFISIYQVSIEQNDKMN